MAGRRGLATVSLATKNPGIAPRGFLRLESLSLSLFYLNVNITRVLEFVKFFVRQLVLYFFPG